MKSFNLLRGKLNQLKKPYKEFSREAPLVCKVAKYIGPASNGELLMVLLQDAEQNYALGFFHEDLKEILETPIIESRLPFEIAILRGEADLSENGKLIIQVWFAILEKHTHVNASAFIGHKYCPMGTYMSSFVDTYSDTNFFLLRGLLIHDYLSYIFLDKRLAVIERKGPELKTLIETNFQRAVYTNWELITNMGFTDDHMMKYLMQYHFEKEYEFLWHELERLRKQMPDHRIEAEKMLYAKNLGIQGRIDRLVINPQDNEWSIIETKTGRSTYSSVMMAQHQALAYALILREFYTTIVDQLIIEYPLNSLEERYQSVDVEEATTPTSLLQMRNEIWSIMVGKRPPKGPFEQCTGNCFKVDECAVQCFRDYGSKNCKACLVECAFNKAYALKPEKFNLVNGYYTWFFTWLENEAIATISKKSELHHEAEEREKRGTCLASLQLKGVKVPKDPAIYSYRTFLKLCQPTKIIAQSTCPECKTDRKEGDTECSNCDYSFLFIEESDFDLSSCEFLFEKADKKKIEGTRLRKGDYVLLTPQEYDPLTVESMPATIARVTAKTVALLLQFHESSELEGFQPNVEYRIDESVSGYMIKNQKRHLNYLFHNHTQKKYSHLRSLLYLLVFQQDTEYLTVPQTLFEDKFFQFFDASQQKGIKQAVRAKGLVCVQGPPGTGKSTVIADMAYRLAQHKKADSTPHLSAVGRNVINYFNYSHQFPKIPVLLTAYTNKAVENLLLKIVKIYPKLRVVRIGRVNVTTDPLVKSHSIEHICKKETTFKDGSIHKVMMPMIVQMVLKRAHIICTTSTMAGSTLLKDFRFHTVIVDEAGQIPEPSAIIPLVKGDNYILVGDHLQLPPISAEELRIRPEIATETLKELALSEQDTLNTSIFERIARVREEDESFIILDRQYRMNRVISDFASQTFYKGKLKPGVIGSQSVGDQTLHDFFNDNSLDQFQYSGPQVVSGLFNPDIPMVFVDTKNLGAWDSTQTAEEQVSDSIYNEKEADIVASITLYFVTQILKHKPNKEKLLFLLDQMGIISGFRAQNQAIKSIVTEKLLPLASNSHIQAAGGIQEILDHIIIDTVDRFQGQEREIILYSFTDSNFDKKISRNNAEPRRLNVSITRAKKKLIFIGNSQTLLTMHPKEDEALTDARTIFKLLYKYVQNHGGIVDLDPNTPIL